MENIISIAVDGNQRYLFAKMFKQIVVGGCNFIHIPIDDGFIEGDCTDFEFDSSKDEINIKLTPLKEVEVKKQSFGKILSTYIN